MEKALENGIARIHMHTRTHTQGINVREKAKTLIELLQVRWHAQCTSVNNFQARGWLLGAEMRLRGALRFPVGGFAQTPGPVVAEGRLWGGTSLPVVGSR